MEINTPQEVIEYLYYNTHAILAPEFAEKLCRIIGIDESPPVHEYTNPWDNNVYPMWEVD